MEQSSEVDENTQVIVSTSTEEGIQILEEGQTVPSSDTETQIIEAVAVDANGQIVTTEVIHQHHQEEAGDGTIVTTAQMVGEDGQSVLVPIVSSSGVGVDGAVTITMVQSVDEAGNITHHEVQGDGTVDQKVKIMSVAPGNTAADQLAAALAEAVSGTEEEEGTVLTTVGGDESAHLHQVLMEDESSMGGDMEVEANAEPWNEEGCLVCNKDIKFDDPVQLGKPVNLKIKEFFLEYLAVGDNVHLESENVFPFCESCATDLEKLMNINRRIENMHKEFNRLRDEVAKKAVKTFITRSKPDWLEEDMRMEAYGNLFPEGEKPKTHKEQLTEVWKNRYDLIQPGPKGPMMIRSMDSRGRVTVVRLNNHGQPIPDRQLASSSDSNLSRVARIAFDGDDDESTGMEEYKCTECPKTFTVKAMLEYHMKLHANANKPYKCNECGKGFAQRGGLVTHSLVHTGAKPYVCQVCNKAFRQKYHLTQHNLIHSGVKPFSCEICHKSFNVKMNLREHMRRHTGDRPYKCPFCTIIGFFRKKMLKEHIIKLHPEEEMPEELLNTETSYITGPDGATGMEDVDGDMDEGEMEIEATDELAFNQQILEGEETEVTTDPIMIPN